LAALGSDAARQPRSVRRVFTDGVKARLDALLTLVPGRSETARRKKAVATLAGIVGALILSRAVDDPTLADEILDAATESFGHA
jgi:TetR/AcrR family transcriptional repressor of nem operon